MRTCTTRLILVERVARRLHLRLRGQLGPRVAKKRHRRGRHRPGVRDSPRPLEGAVDHAVRIGPDVAMMAVPEGLMTTIKLFARQLRSKMSPILERGVL